MEKNKAREEADKLHSGVKERTYPGQDFGGNKPVGKGPRNDKELAKDLEVSYPDDDSLDQRG